MGGGISTPEGVENVPVPDNKQDVVEQLSSIRAELNEKCGDNEFATGYFTPYFDRKTLTEESELDELQEERVLFLDAIKHFMLLTTPAPPETAEDIIERSEDSINLCGADRDDEGIPGNVKVFGIEPLSEVPACLFGEPIIAKLVTLSLKKNHLDDLPSTIQDLVNLKHLDVSENCLSELPDSIGEMTQLETLVVAENNLPILPSTIGKMTSLTTLIAFKNQLTKIPDEIGDCLALEEVNFFNNKLIKVPKSLAKLANLKDLNLGGNKLKTIPSTKLWVNLERLALSWNTIVVLNDFGGMVKLKMLQLNRNQIESVEDGCFDGCVDLENLDISSNRFTKLPTSISDLAGLKALNVSSNQITEMVPVKNSPHLEILNIGSNKISELDGEDLGSLANLKTLFVNSNALTALPAGLANLKNLSRMNITGNENLSIEPELSQQLQTYCADNKGRWVA